MAGQVRKVENPETLPKERFQGATFENIIPIFLEFKVFEKFAKKENKLFASLNMQKISGKLTKFSVFALKQFTKLELGVNLAQELYFSSL